MSFVNVIVRVNDEEIYEFEGITNAFVDENGVLCIQDGADTIAMFQIWDHWIKTIPEPNIEEWTEEEDPI